MGFAMYSGISFGIWGCVAIRQLAVQPTSSHTGAVTDFRPRDSESSPKECNRKHSQHERVFQLNVHCMSIGSLKDVLHKGDFMGKIDLEDTYLSVPVHQEH